MDIEGTLERLAISTAETVRQAEVSGETQTYDDLVRRFRDICLIAARTSGKGPRSVTEKNIVLANIPATAGVPEGQLYARIETTDYRWERIDFSTADVFSTEVYFKDDANTLLLATEHFFEGDSSVLAAASQTAQMLGTAIGDPLLNPQFHQPVAS